ncbi:PBP1A family penicillin-binding protein [bacterium]|nr:PBP1A family penicillin-binding protein [bacterium]
MRRRAPKPNKDNFQRLNDFGGVKPAFDMIFMSLKVTMSSLTLIMALVVSILAVFVWLDYLKVPDLSILESYQPGTELVLYDKDDKLICSFPAKERREVVAMSKISQNIVKAVIAAEDRGFFQHSGVSWEGVMRAMLTNISKGHQVQGGSTITQQLTKNIFFAAQKRNISVKIAEAIVSQQIESKYSKEKILELYLNQIYFGSGAYGVEAAAKTYFDKHASQLTIGESAFLAGIIKSPSILGDKENIKTAIQRQQYVINAMYETGLISQEEADWAINQPLVFRQAQDAIATKIFVPKYPYYSSLVAQEVKELLPYTGSKRIKVFTCLDSKAQNAAEAAIKNARLPKGIDQAALASINLNDGSVVALVGGSGQYLENQWNSAVHPHTMGSVFKPMVYLTAFEGGAISPSSMISDSPLSVVDENDEKNPIWKPKNFDEKYSGMITVAEALKFSKNVCAVRVAQQVGIPSIVSVAGRMGINETLAPTMALSLGASAASPLSIATAYGTIARGGVRVKPRFIRKIENEKGKTLATFGPEVERVMDERPVVELVDILKEVVASGTGVASRLKGIPSAGKTGTADDGKDLWFAGFTPDLVTVVWTGNSKNQSVGSSTKITGGAVAAPIWRQYNSAYYKDHQKPITHLIGSGLGQLDTNMGKANKDKLGAGTADQEMIYSGDVFPQSQTRTTQKRINNINVKKTVTRKSPGVTEYTWESSD